MELTFFPLTTTTTTTLFILLSSSLILLLLLITNHKNKRRRLPPGPPPLPIIGNLHLIRPPLHKSFDNLTNRYGGLVFLRLGSTPAVVAGSADIAREFFKTHDLAFANRPPSTAARVFAYETAGFAFAPYGPYWRFMRRLCMSELLGGATVEQLRPVRRTELLSLLNYLHERSLGGKEVDMSKELIKMTNNVITRMTTGTTAANAEEARVLVKQVAELIGLFNAEDFLWFCKGLDLQGLNRRINDVHSRFDKLMERLIEEKEEERRARGGRKKEGVRDLLDIMLEVADDPTADVKITRENIKGFVLDTFTAGSDSSAATVEWALAELINNPHMLQKLRQDIDAVVGKSRLVEESDIRNLPYLQAIIKETLRLHPAAPLATRISDRDVKVGQYTIPSGTNLFVNAYSVNRDPSCWKNPLEFRPERFLEEQEGVDFKGQHYQFVPFGSGRRVCPGISLALQVVQVTLAALVQCFEWRVGDGVEKVDMSEGIGMVILRAKPLVCVPVARLDPFPLLTC